MGEEKRRHGSWVTIGAMLNVLRTKANWTSRPIPESTVLILIAVMWVSETETEDVHCPPEGPSPAAEHPHD